MSLKESGWMVFPGHETICDVVSFWQGHGATPHPSGDSRVPVAITRYRRINRSVPNPSNGREGFLPTRDRSRWRAARSHRPTLQSPPCPPFPGRRLYCRPSFSCHSSFLGPVSSVRFYEKSKKQTIHRFCRQADNCGKCSKISKISAHCAKNNLNCAMKRREISL